MAPVLTPGNDVLCYSYNTATLFKYGEMPPLVTLFFPSDPECLGVEVPGGNLSCHPLSVFFCGELLQEL